MVDEKDRLTRYIFSRITAYFVYNNLEAKRNRTDGAISAEDFLAGLYNIIYKSSGCDYQNANRIVNNFPGIDLIDGVNGVGVQVTVSETLSKVKKTFDKIPHGDDNDVFKRVDFFVQSPRLTKGQRDFGPVYEGYQVKVWCYKDLFAVIDAIDDIDLLKEIHLYVKTRLVLPDVDLESVNIDGAVFGMLFSALKDKSETVVSEGELIYRNSPKDKRKKFDSQWNMLVALYKESLGMVNGEVDLQRLKNYNGLVSEVFSEDLDEEQKNSIMSYLRTQSMMILHENNDDAVVSIKKLCDNLSSELKITFVPYNHILSFCLTMFFACDVFPLIMNQHES